MSAMNVFLRYPRSVPQKRKRAAILAHFDPDGWIDDHVMHLVRSLKSVADQLVVVSTSHLLPSETEKLAGIADRTIVRENVGYDFMSWKIGLQTVSLDDFDELILCNDSVYGPLWPLDEAFTRMARKKCDFWGLTANKQNGFHLQSYFLVFRKSIIESPSFKAFWSNIHIQGSKQEIIEKYEIGMTSLFLSNGHKAKYLFRFSPIDILNRNIDRKYIIRRLFKNRGKGSPRRLDFNPSIVFWSALLKRRIPFLKVELVKFSVAGKSPAPSFERLIDGITSSGSLYNVAFIKNHIRRVYGLKGNFGFPERSET